MDSTRTYQSDMNPSVRDWLLGHHNEAPRQSTVSRHWFGTDLNAPVSTSAARHETDVRPVGRVRQAAHLPESHILEEPHAARGSHREIYGYPDGQRLPADAVLYGGDGRPRGTLRRSGGDGGPAAPEPCFYLGGAPSDQSPPKAELIDSHDAQISRTAARVSIQAR